MAPRLKINVKQPPVWSAVEGLHTGMDEQFEAEMQVAAANLPLPQPGNLAWALAVHSQHYLAQTRL